MRYVQLRAFHYVAIHGGFSRAAEALFLTQPAISDQCASWKKNMTSCFSTGIKTGYAYGIWSEATRNYPSFV